MIKLSSAIIYEEHISPCDLAKLPYLNLALADPAAVPAGKYAKSWLSGIMCRSDTLWALVKRRVVPTSDVRGAPGLVMADREMVGIVYKTDHLQFPTKTRLLYEVKESPGPLLVPGLSTLEAACNRRNSIDRR